MRPGMRAASLGRAYSSEPCSEESSAMRHRVSGQTMSLHRELMLSSAWVRCLRASFASGKYLIPGLWDMHVHTGRRNIFLPLYIANGVTGVRDMGGDLEEPTGDLSARYIQLRLWREAIERGLLV